MAEQYFESVPAVASAPGEVRLELPDMTLDLRTDTGVFAREGIDAGTKLLLMESPPPPASGVLLDLGCGYGPIACTLARRSPAASVWAVDVNERALALTRANAETVRVDNVMVAKPDDVPEDVTFVGIWSNPPIRVGKAALHALLEHWLTRLQPGASAWLVVHRHLGGDSLAKFLDSAGYPTTRHCSRLGYRVLRVDAHAS